MWLRRLLLLVALLTAAGTTAWLLGRGDPAPPRSAIENAEVPGLESGARAGAPAANPPPMEPHTTGSEPGSALVGPTTRVPQHRAAESTSAVSVRAPDGSGVSGAIVSWTPIRSDLLEPFVSWAYFEREALLEASRFARTDQDGVAVLSDGPLIAGADGAVVWITHPEHMAERLWLEANEALGDRTITLRPAEGLEVIVRRSDGGAVEGATVTQVFTRPGGLEAEPHARRTRVERCFVRVVPVPASGQVRLAALPDEQGLFAEQGALRSLAWKGRGLRRAELLLGPTLTVGGIVRFPPEVSQEHTVVECMVPEEDSQRVHAIVPVRDDGNWGPVLVPLPKVDEYIFGLDGPSVLPDVQRIKDPKPDHIYRIDFEARTGFDLVVQVVDEEGQALSGTSVDVNVLDPGGWSSQDRQVDADGKVKFQLEPSGSVWVRGSRPGYQTTMIGPLELWAAPAEPLQIAMPVAGRVAGHCLHEGRPVVEFTVYAWQGDAMQATSEAFRGREDGAFELDEVALGNIQLLAWAAGLGSLGPLTVKVAPGEVTHVELELPTGVRGRGRVIDGRTQEPIAGAEAVAVLAYRETRIGQRGEPVDTTTDGEFELSGLDLTGNHVHVSADGYAPTYVVGSSVHGEEIEFGIVRLQRRQDLTVQLRSHAPIDFTSCRASLEGIEQRPMQAFDAGGFSRFGALPPGDYDMLVQVGGATSIATHVSVPTGGPLDLVLEVDCERTLHVEVVAADPSAMPVNGIIGIHVGADLDSCGRWYHLPESGRIDLPLCGGEGAIILVRDSDGAEIGMARVRAEDVASGSLRLELGGERGTVRVLDRFGQPVPDAGVCLTFADQPSTWSAARYTGPDGAARFDCLPPQPLLAFVRHPSKGIATEIPVDRAALIGVGLELVLDPRAELRILLLDGQQPVAGARVELYEAFRGVFGFDALVSGPDGNVERELVTPGRYLYAVGGPGLWPTRGELQVRLDGHAIGAQVRRLGSLEFHADRLGQPVAGVRIDLESLEFGQSVAQWLGEGRVTASAEDLTSDEKGRLRLDGLPHGTYAYRALWKGAVATEGSVEVPASAVGTVRVLVP